MDRVGEPVVEDLSDRCLIGVDQKSRAASDKESAFSRPIRSEPQNLLLNETRRLAGRDIDAQVVRQQSVEDSRRRPRWAGCRQAPRETSQRSRKQMLIAAQPRSTSSDRRRYDRL